VTVHVGVIGVGTIGQDHVDRLTRLVPGAQVVALADADRGRAEAVAGRLTGARVLPTGHDLIRADEVEAVLVASWGPTHAEFVLAAIAAGKPVFCEKPLAPTIDECLRIVEAEAGRGRHLVRVGFMRRYDAAYRALKRTLADAALGAPLMVHCAHRNQDVPPHYGGDMPITDTAIHEIDIVRWLLEQEIVAARVLQPRKTSRARADLQDPLLVILETAGGVIVDVEVFVTLPYGYDIRCEVVCEFGTAALSDGGPVVLRKDGLRADHVPNGFHQRFGAAYEAELREWVDSIRTGEAAGPSAWDGYAATAVAASCVEAWRTGERVPVQLRERPAFYGRRSAL
jgi:myo-inositol 2-dehydrogenase / D-chiro-inositol 1-dehydrogenase